MTAAPRRAGASGDRNAGRDGRDSTARRARRTLRALVVLAVAGIGCRAADHGPIKIGVVVGGDGVEGARLAIDSLRRSGGVDGRPIELAIPANRSPSAEPSIRAADWLAADRTVVAVVGHSNSAASLAASQVYNARGLPQVAPTTTAPLFSDAGPYSFRLVPDDRRQAAFLARQVAGTSARRIAVVYVNDDYGRALAAATRAELARAGRQPVYQSPYIEGSPNVQLAATGSAVADARPDLLLWLGRAPELAALLVALRARLPHLPVYASDGVDQQVTYAEPSRFVGVRFVRFVDATAPDPKLQRFRALYRSSLHREPTTDAVTGYDATMLIVAALRAGARSRSEVRDYLEQVGRARPAFVGLSGTIAFDARGDVLRPHLLAEVRADGVYAVTPK